MIKTKEELVQEISGKLKNPTSVEFPGSLISDLMAIRWADEIVAHLEAKGISFHTRLDKIGWSTIPGIKPFPKWLVAQATRPDTVGEVCRQVISEVDFPCLSEKKEDYVEHVRKTCPTNFEEHLKGFENLYAMYEADLKSGVFSG